MTTTRADAQVTTQADAPLPAYRVNLMRAGYLLMVVGLALVKWPLFFRDGGIASLPVYEGVVATLLTAMSLLALLGLRHPLAMLPVLVFESLWKLIWLAAVGLPYLVAGDHDAQLSSVLASVWLVVIILAVTPWDHVWRHYVRASGTPWRRA
ncbi:hypothetical protein [Ornithinimicrobium cryptoxanthini]|uniref:hypothetical protein n=1 Tax=Ornithinimicrobium cryptoxanthini TaxID=2934161 RepID=UPI0021184298|nr:hypothetical protein [Ornithinimicrobium cryptoxanthini]